MTRATDLLQTMTAAPACLIRLATAAMVAIGLLSACSGEQQSSEDLVVLKRGNGAEPDTLDPHKATGTWENNIVGDMFIGLYTVNAAGQPMLGAAEAHTVSEDLLTHTFTIREGHVWSDGTPVTAHDFVFSLRRQLDPATASQYASLLYLIKNGQAVNTGQEPLEALGVSAKDDRTFVIELNYPAPYINTMLTHYTTYPVPKHVVEAHGARWIRPGTAVSNGAYVLDNWIPQDHVKVRKNPLFFDAENVQIDEVYYFPTTDSTAALKQFRAKELDLNTAAPLQQIDWMRENIPNELRIHPFMGVSYIVLNAQKPPFDNANVRMALSMALDRKVFTDDILRAGQIPAYSFVPPGVSNYRGGVEAIYKNMTMEERQTEARALLAEAGFDESNPLKFEYQYREGVDGRRIAVTTRDMWQEIGVEAELIQGEVKTHYANLRTGNFKVGDAGWIMDYSDPQNLYFLLDSRSGPMNYGRYANPEFDRLMDLSNFEPDIEKRKDIFQQMEQILVEDQPLITTFFNSNTNLVHTHVKGWEDNVVNIHRTRFLRIEKGDE